MTRLSTAPLAADEVHAVMTDTELEHTSKAVWAYLRAVSDPQAVRPVAEVLGMARGTVMRAMTALEAKGLIRRVNGVWVSEETS